MKQIRYLLEGLALYILYGFFWILPLTAASATGGWLMRKIGTRLAASRKALANIKKIYPDKSPEEYQEILAGMWDNLGRVFAEYPHLKKISSRLQVEGEDILKQIAKDHDTAVFFTTHAANWEITPVLMGKCGLDVAGVYRKPNNPWAERLLSFARKRGSKPYMIPKGKSGTRDIVRMMKSGRFIGMLVDQKYNEGLLVDFLGHPAKTSPAYIQLCQKFDCPLIPVQIIREQGSYFRAVISKPVDTKEKSEEEVLNITHAIMKGWIDEAPAQWLWLHRRWPKVN